CSIAQNYGNWIELDSMNVARVGHAMVELPNGNILVSGSGIDSIQASAEIYDFSLGKWRQTTPMNIARDSHTLVLLESGKVLAIGGYKEQSCELFNPENETWTMADSIPTYRWIRPSITKLKNGNILVAGGGYIDSTTHDLITLKAAEVYDVWSKEWKTLSSMNISRRQHTATLLQDGRVLVTGGFNENLSTNECEIYDPVADSWTMVEPMLENRWDHSAILLKNGNVFVSGGNPLYPWLKSCEVYNANENQWFSVDDMLAYRTGHKIYYLSEIDKLYILGGDAQPETTEDTWEIYDPISLTPVYKESFPVNIFLDYNNLQMSNENLFLASGAEYEIPAGGLPYSWPSKRSWMFDVITHVHEDGDNKIKEFKLEQNYPNPFNPTTTISYTLKSSSIVKLVIYNSLGQEISVLINKKQLAGFYEIYFNASDLPSGVYYYQLTISNNELGINKTIKQTKKMVLIR
ncbi:MAG TPA: T9SS C-terminal target domain-containing protein, partial [Ignavibacteria bacterium]|nr:T9SS C-terminal target domain-containing protein [Ignavibacteria bacterium]